MSKILLVDDDIELTDLLAEVLRLTGFEVEVANNGQEALDKLNASHQLILLDVMIVSWLPALRQFYVVLAHQKVLKILPHFHQKRIHWNFVV